MSSAILGRGSLPRRRRHHLHHLHLLLVFLFLPPPPPFIAFTLLPVASEGHPCVPLCRSDIRAALPSLTCPARTPWATLFDQPRQRAARVPGAACRHGDQTLSPNPLNQTPIPYPSELRYPLPPPLSRRAPSFALPFSSPKRESFDILMRFSLTALHSSSSLSHHTFFVSLPRLFLVVLSLSSYFASLSSDFFSFFSLHLLRRIAKCRSSSFLGEFVLCLLSSFVIIHS